MSNSARRTVYAIIVLTVCLVPAFICLAVNGTKTVAHYKVSSRGFSIGDITTTQRMGEEGGGSFISFETRTAIKASFLWMGYDLDTVEKGVLREGALVSYSRKGRDNGVMVDVEGRLGRSSFKFEVREHGVTHVVDIPRTTYDYTTMECPEARLDFSEKQKIALRILDVEKMVVVRREYHLVRNDLYAVAGKEYPCRIVDYTDPNKKARRWTSWDGTTVVMFRQDGTGKDSYSVRATSVAREM